MGYPFRQPTFSELVKGTDPCKLDDLHKEKVEALMVYDPKRKALVPSRFCSFHLAGFDLDEKSTAPLGPLCKASPSPSGRRPAEYVTANERLEVASSSINVISLRVVRAGPVFTYPVDVYGKVIARDEVDYKCVYLFDRERKDAQLINSEKDMLSLTGPYRPLITLDLMYFEFDLKIKGRDDHDEEQFSKGVIPYYCKPDHKRIILQLPSFNSTVKLVLQRVSLPVAAIIDVNVVNEGHDDTIVYYDGKITAGTTRNCRQHMVLYDSSVPSVCSERRNGSLVLNRKLLAVNGYERDPAFEKDQLVLYVCFLDAVCEIEDEDEMCPEEEDEDDEDEDEEAGCEIEDEHTIPEEEDGDGDTDEDGDTDTDGDGDGASYTDTDTGTNEDEDGDGEVEDPKNVVTLKYPQCETVWEHGSPKLKVKVDWTAVPYSQKGSRVVIISLEIVSFQPVIDRLIITVVGSLSEIDYSFLIALFILMVDLRNIRGHGTALT